MLVLAINFLLKLQLAFSGLLFKQNVEQKGGDGVAWFGWERGEGQSVTEGNYLRIWRSSAIDNISNKVLLYQREEAKI